jgi:serine/threonine-protein kinase
MDPEGFPAPLVVGRYRLYHAIGSGGMATVHLGRLLGAEGFGRTVAIKRLRAQSASEPGVVQAFLDEARLATRIRHANVVATIDAVTEGGEAFLVMEYVEGESLASLVRRGAPDGIPAPVAVAIVIGALRGLHAAHDAVSESGDPLNLVHRDVSPQNILVGVDGVARVLDFGIAKALGRQQTTRNGELKGKLAYMAPEQLMGAGVTRRTDVFAAGIVLWELLTGRRLFGGEHEGETVNRALSAVVEPPSNVSPRAPRELDPIVLRALDRDLTKRYATAEQMAAELEKAMPPAPASVVGEWTRRVASDALEARARKVREVELHSTTSRPTGATVEASELVPVGATDAATLPIVATTVQRAPRRRWIAVVGLAVVLFAGTGWIALGHRGTASPGGVASSNPVVPAVESASPAPVPSSVAAEPPPATAATSAVSTVPVAAPRSSSPRLPRVTPAKQAGSSRGRLYTRD